VSTVACANSFTMSEDVTGKSLPLEQKMATAKEHADTVLRGSFHSLQCVTNMTTRRTEIYAHHPALGRGKRLLECDNMMMLFVIPNLRKRGIFFAPAEVVEVEPEEAEPQPCAELGMGLT